MADTLFYVIDSSSLIDMKRYYPMGTFKTLWARCHALINERRLGAPATVFEELARWDDELHQWAKKHKKLFHDESAFIQQQNEIMSSFSGLVDPNKTNNDADPWIIAMAREKSISTLLDVCVVTEESKRQSPGKKRIRIPEVCDYYSICCCSMVEMFQKEGWVF